jgi:hypothetical protein
MLSRRASFRRVSTTQRISCMIILHRSLVQIKSHAQKVLKRMDAGENVFRRLEEHHREIDSLVVQSARQRDALREAGINVNATAPSKTSLSTAAKRKRQVKRVHSAAKDNEQSDRTEPPKRDVQSVPETNAEREVESGQAVIAAAALCQLSTLAAPWDQKGATSTIEL